MLNLFCVVGVDPEITNLNLFNHFLEFYTHQQVDHFYIILQSNHNDSERIEQARELLKKFGIREKFLWQDEYSSPVLNRFLLKALKDYGKDDWWIIADVDEFHEFPGKAREFLMECEEKQINCIKGKICDRVSSNGELRFIDDIHIPLEEQFPLGGDITGQLAQGNTGKIAALKPPLIPGNGHHAIVKKRRKATYYPLEIRTHHFKWDSLVLKRIERRYRFYLKNKIEWYGESERVYQYLLAHSRILPKHFSLYPVDPIPQFKQKHTSTKLFQEQESL
jgi:hypothetical protein